MARAAKTTPRRRQLLVLADQGDPARVEVASFGMAGRNRGWDSHARNFISANRPAFQALEIRPELEPEPSRITLRLRPGGVVGAIPLRAPDTRKVTGGIVVRPRFGWDGIGPLLQQVGWTASPSILEMPLVPGSAKEVPPWVLAGPVLQRFARLLREMRRGFRMEEAVRQNPRGQVLWQRYATEQVPRGQLHLLPCRYPDLGPDLLLRSYLKWGVDRVYRSLVPSALADPVARRLADQALALLDELADTPPRVPDRDALARFQRLSSLSSAVLERGLQALTWVVDERGLAGAAATDGLAWALPMHALFERWVEHLARTWAREFGGEVLSGRTGETVVPVHWERAGRGSLRSLVPDLVVRHGKDVYVIDAKYKGHFQELDTARWMALADELREEHRHDLHQALAYAAVFDGATVTTALVYPMYEATWVRLHQHRGTVVEGYVSGGGRQVRVALVGLPVRIPEGVTVHDLARSLEALRYAGPEA